MDGEDRPEIERGERTETTGRRCETADAARRRSEADDTTGDGHGRRAFLGLAATAGVGALAGCSGTTATTVSAARRPPSVPEDRLSAGGWAQLDDVTQDPAFEEEFGPVTVTASTRTLLYEDAALREEIAEKTLGQASSQFATFFATRVTFDPDLTSLPAGAGRQQLLDQVESQSRQQFQNRLKDAGLAPVERVNTGTFEVASGTSARLTEYEATFAFEGFGVTVGDEDITVEGGEIPVAGHLAAWIANDSVLVSGGAYPAANFARTMEQSPSAAIDLTVDIDLGLTPDAYREELFELMRHVE
ncbi:DUF6517 family protein [Halogeometricum limi]|uniref:Uncharacterized protein n=1 Tax=Halogeometricum limi TaxID=555875 RepID=A0A1I6H778_9EURY|nr:DUF6517 family protein [Halogeometricum limi]SFR50333.1 hypothetical protein SAMN04488124_1871 [Halogeometricum limi]